MGTSVRKVKGGKLLRVKVDGSGSTVERLTITGDFFIYPEEGLFQLESRLVGGGMEGGEASLTARIEAILSEGGIIALGFSPSDLAQAILEARG